MRRSDSGSEEAFEFYFFLLIIWGCPTKLHSLCVGKLTLNLHKWGQSIHLLNKQRSLQTGCPSLWFNWRMASPEGGAKAWLGWNHLVGSVKEGVGLKRWLRESGGNWVETREDLEISSSVVNWSPSPAEFTWSLLLYGVNFGFESMKLVEATFIKNAGYQKSLGRERRSHVFLSQLFH